MYISHTNARVGNCLFCWFHKTHFDKEKINLFRETKNLIDSLINYSSRLPEKNSLCSFFFSSFYLYGFCVWQYIVHCSVDDIDICLILKWITITSTVTFTSILNLFKMNSNGFLSHQKSTKIMMTTIEILS